MWPVSTLVGTLEVWCSIYVAEITGWHTPAAHFPHRLLVFLKSSSSSPSLPDHIALLAVALFSSGSMFHISWCLPFALRSSSRKFSVCHPVARGCFGNSLWLGETNWIVVQTGNTNLPAYSLTSCLASSCARKSSIKLLLLQISAAVNKPIELLVRSVLGSIWSDYRISGIYET